MENTLKNKPLLAILPFDHRSYFEKLLEFTEPLSDVQKAEISEYKKLIYAGYEKSLELGIPKDSSAILVDDVFGLDILLDAKSKGYQILQSTEVSGIDHFEFEHGNDWQAWIEKVQPTCTKVLIRYNVDGNKGLNKKTRDNLKLLSDYSHTHHYKFLIEILVPSQETPDLLIRALQEIQNDGIEPDIWKIEGMTTIQDYEQVIVAAHANNRNHVGIVVLGKNQTDEVVETWLKVGATVPGIIGFAVGRTVFLDALMKYKNHEMSRDQAVTEIANRFKHFYDVFTV